MRPRVLGRRLRLVILGGIGLLAVGVLVILSTPRLRQQWLGMVWSVIPKPPARALAIPPRSEPPPPLSGRQIHIPSADAEGRVVVPVTDAAPRELPSEGVPFGWDVKEFSGHAGIDLMRVDGRLAVRLRTEKSAFALFRDVIVDPAQTPYLTWSWKVTRLPEAGDAREPARNDQAAGIYVVFPRWPSPRTASDVLGYVWDTRAPVGTRGTSARAANIRLLVVESGRSSSDGWRRTQRNVAVDYAAVFGRPAPRIGKIALAADTDDTGTASEAFVGPLIFSRTRWSGMENPRIMLR